MWARMRDIPLKKVIPSLVVCFQGKEKATRPKVKLQSRSYITHEQLSRFRDGWNATWFSEQVKKCWFYVISCEIALFLLPHIPFLGSTFLFSIYMPRKDKQLTCRFIRNFIKTSPNYETLPALISLRCLISKTSRFSGGGGDLLKKINFHFRKNFL